MNRKHLFLVAFMILAVFLSGCNGVVTPATDEAKIKSVVYEFVLALNDQNWSKAKGYCVYGSDAYYKVSLMEDMFNNIHLTCGNVTLSSYMIIYNVYIYGNYSEVYGDFYCVISGCGQVEGGGGIAYTYLQKVGNSWKIYGP